MELSQVSQTNVSQYITNKSKIVEKITPKVLAKVTHTKKQASYGLPSPPSPPSVMNRQTVTAQVHNTQHEFSDQSNSDLEGTWSTWSEELKWTAAQVSQVRVLSSESEKLLEELDKVERAEEQTYRNQIISVKNASLNKRQKVTPVCMFEEITSDPIPIFKKPKKTPKNKKIQKTYNINKKPQKI